MSRIIIFFYVYRFREFIAPVRHGTIPRAHNKIAIFCFLGWGGGEWEEVQQKIGVKVSPNFHPEPTLYFYLLRGLWWIVIWLGRKTWKSFWIKTFTPPPQLFFFSSSRVCNNQPSLCILFPPSTLCCVYYQIYKIYLLSKKVTRLSCFDCYYIGQCRSICSWEGCICLKPADDQRYIFIFSKRRKRKFHVSAG